MINMEKIKNSIPVFSNSNPIIYDNDSPEDCYTDEYLVALASSGDINLRGIITTTSHTDPWHKPEILYEWLVNGREQIVQKARRSGMANLPKPVRGPNKSLVKPSSGNIDDTTPENSEGGRLIVQEAKKASPEKPLLIIMGGQSTVVADAYLIDKSIKNNVLVLWLAGGGESSNDLYGYNGEVDSWATYIIVKNMKTVLFGELNLTEAAPYVPKHRLLELPYTELREFMIEKELPHVNYPREHDCDVHAAISVMRPDYIKKVEVKSFCKFSSEGKPLLKDDVSGNVFVVIEMDKNVATDEWWRALKNPAAYKNNPIQPINLPYNGQAFNVPGKIQLELYDTGGEGISYHCRRTRNASDVQKTAFRPTDGVRVDLCSASSGEYCLEPLDGGEWIKYTIYVKKAGMYNIEVCAASAMCGGIFHLDFNGINRSGMILIPETDGWQEWKTIITKEVELDAGIQTMKLICDSGRCSLKYIEFT